MRKFICLCLALIMMTTVISGCSGKNNIDAKAHCIIETEGDDGEATVSFIPNREMYQATLVAIECADENDISNLIDSINYSIISDKTNKFYNGDEIEVEVSYEKVLAKELDISFSNRKFTFTVEELVDPLAIDPFQGLTVSYKGYSPIATLETNNANCDEFVKEVVTFTASKEKDIANGDIIAITANYDEAALTNEDYKFSASTKDYTVQDLPAFVDSLNGVDNNLLVAKMNEVVYYFLEANNNPASWGEAQTYQASSWDMENIYTIVKLYYFKNPTDPSKNYIAAIFKVDSIATCTESNGVTGTTVGDVIEISKYIIANVKDVLVADGKSTFENSYSSVKFYSDDKELVIKEAKSSFPDHTLEEVALS